jgi:3-methyl-2-oxobutanoate hydroxymethyltransferase
VERLLEDAKALEAAGCFAIVIESVPDLVSEYITNSLKIPTIGIGAGKFHIHNHTSTSNFLH